MGLMFDWLQNPHADYVLAAYGVAAVALAWLGLASWLAARRIRAAWRKLQERGQL
jgi:heme exporter protein CcmD